MSEQIAILHNIALLIKQLDEVERELLAKIDANPNYTQRQKNAIRDKYFVSKKARRDVVRSIEVVYGVKMFREPLNQIVMRKEIANANF